MKAFLEPIIPATMHDSNYSGFINMSQKLSLPSYTELSEALKHADSVFQAAEVHGMLCGIICVSPDQNPSSWVKLILGTKKKQKDSEFLQELYTATHQQMGDFSFEFALLLPDDTTDINIRTEALGLWCQGFLTGLQQAPTPIEQHTSADAADALNDITEIAQVNHGEIMDSEENEAAYFELADYIRLAALMLYHEFHSQKSTQDNPYLH